MILQDSGKFYYSFKIAYYTKGKYTTFKGYDEDLFVSLVLESKNLDMSDPILTFLFEGSKVCSKKILVPKQYIDIIKEAWETEMSLFLTISKIANDDVCVCSISSVSYLIKK